MRLGELLVALGAIQVSELDAALQHQSAFGGRLGTNLVELGLVTSDTVGHALARLHRVPAALARHLAAVDPRAVACLPRDVARNEIALPIAFSLTEGRRLVVCLRDPGRREGLDAVRRAVDFEVVTAVAPELALHLALERHYQLRRPQRFAQASSGEAMSPPARASAALDGDLDIDITVDDLDGELAMPAALELVDLDHSGVARSEPAQIDTRRAPRLFSITAPAPTTTPAPAATPATTAPTTSHAPAATPATTHAPAAPTTTPAATAPTTTTVPTHATAASPSTSASPTSSPSTRFAPRALSADAAARYIAEAGRRSEVSEAVLAYLQGHFDAGLMLIVKQGLALGYRGFGGRLTGDTVDALVVPLSVPSIFASAFERRALTRLDPRDTRSAVQDRFYRLFPGEPISDAIVVPVATAGRIISMIYAHGTLDARGVAGLVQVAAACEDAFLRLIRAAR